MKAASLTRLPVPENSQVHGEATSSPVRDRTAAGHQDPPGQVSIYVRWLVGSKQVIGHLTLFPPRGSRKGF